MTNSIRVSTTVNSSPKAAYKTLKDIEQLPKLMPQLKKARILWDLPPNRRISEWEVDIEGTRFRWKQEDNYNDKQLTLIFRVIEGDYRAKGRWIISGESSNKAKITVEATFDWGISTLAAHVGPILEQKAKKNFIRMLAVLRKEAWAGRKTHG